MLQSIERLPLLFLLTLGTGLMPYLLLRSGRRAWLGIDVVISFAACSIWLAASVLRIPVDADLFVALLAAAKCVAFFSLVALDATELARMTAGRFAAYALMAYVCLIPHTLQWPIDGDEPYYLLMTESVISDSDFDLRNQYQHLDQSETGRLDLQPQPGDPVGREGEQRSRHEPFLAVLLVPGYVLGGLYGAVLTMALFATLLARSLFLLLEEYGVEARVRIAVVALLSLAAPVIFYAVRIWPEIPAAWLLTEALRGRRRNEPARILLALAAMSLLKLRFVVIAAAFLLELLINRRRDRKVVLLAAAALLLPSLIVFYLSGSPSNVHTAGQLSTYSALKLMRGIFGVLLDGQAGLLFHAPFWLAAVIAGAASLRWKRDWFYLLVALPYLLLLLPRDEWHGGWAPPLRYLVVFTPLIALGGARLLVRCRPAVPLLAITASLITIFGLAKPWALFHIANGESRMGEALSRTFSADVSRTIPSFIRMNDAAIVASGALIVFFLLISIRPLRRAMASHVTSLFTAIASLVLAGCVAVAFTPAETVHLEDAHVRKVGGSLYPDEYMVARFRFEGGWEMKAGDSASFKMASGPVRLRYSSTAGASMRFNAITVALPSTNGSYQIVSIPSFPGGLAEISMIEGGAVLERISVD